LVISGVAVSTALGVPLGTLIGQVLGWRGCSPRRRVRRDRADRRAGADPIHARTGGGAAVRPSTRSPSGARRPGLNFLVFAAMFAALTYLVPFLQRSPASPAD